jgi:hypothetical protein
MAAGQRRSTLRPCHVLTPAAGHLFTSPDVSIDRKRRASLFKDDHGVEAEGEKWVSSHHKHVAKDISKIRILSSYEKRH